MPFYCPVLKLKQFLLFSKQTRYLILFYSFCLVFTFKKLIKEVFEVNMKDIYVNGILTLSD